MGSALIGQPPNTEEDYWIVLGILRRAGLEGRDPAKGAQIPPPRPLNDQYTSRGPRIIAGSSVCIILIILITGTRVLIRALYRGLRWGWDDWMIILASLVVLAWFSGSIATVVYGGRGKHIWDVTYHQWYMYGKIANINQKTYLPGAIFVKMSIVLFNRRITGLASKVWRRINDGFMVILALYLISYSILLGVRCPSNNLTLIQVGKAKSYTYCSQHQGFQLSLGLATIHVILGFCLLLTPIVVLWKIKMDRIKKFQLFVIFIIGSVSCIAALMIVITQYQIRRDATWNSLDLQTWILLDLFFGVVVASLPILYGQLPKTWFRFKSYTRSHGLSQTGHRDVTNGHGDLGPKRRGGDGGIYVQTDIECHGNKMRGDDQVELLEQPCRPAVALINRHHPTSRVIITSGDVDTEFSKQASCNESVESTVTPPMASKN